MIRTFTGTSILKMCRTKRFPTTHIKPSYISNDKISHSRTFLVFFCQYSVDKITSYHGGHWAYQKIHLDQNLEFKQILFFLTSFQIHGSLYLSSPCSFSVFRPHNLSGNISTLNLPFEIWRHICYLTWLNCRYKNPGKNVGRSISDLAKIYRILVSFSCIRM